MLTRTARAERQVEGVRRVAVLLQEHWGVRMNRSADGARVSAAASRAAMIVASALLLGAAGCTSTSDVLDAAPEPVAAADGSPQAPAVAPDRPRSVPPAAVPPAAVPPDPAQRIHRTLPPNSRDLMPGAAAF